MSYEGYTIALCEKGHQFHWDAMEDYHGFGDNKPHLCPTFTGPAEICNLPPCWWTDVDQTNGIDEATGHCPGYVELKVDKEAVYDRCTCGHGCDKLLASETYKIPTNAGHIHYKGFVVDLSSHRQLETRLVASKVEELGLDPEELHLCGGQLKIPFDPKLVESRPGIYGRDSEGFLKRLPDMARAHVPTGSFLPLNTREELDKLIFSLPQMMLTFEWRLTKEEELLWDKESREP
jgi:hypothetical protein